MLVSQWALLAGMSFVLTLVWGFAAPTTNVYVAGGLSAIGWGAAALTAPGLQTASGGALLAAGSPVLSFVSLAFAAVSTLATVGYRTGHYPPRPDDDTIPINE